MDTKKDQGEYPAPSFFWGIALYYELGGTFPYLLQPFNGGRKNYLKCLKRWNEIDQNIIRR